MNGCGKFSIEKVHTHGKSNDIDFFEKSFALVAMLSFECSVKFPCLELAHWQSM
jgi:hypothetical protein